MLISIKWQHLFFGWLYISGIQFRFLDLTYSCRTLFYDTFDMTLLHLILVTTPKCGYSSSVGMYRNICSSCFHMFIDRILCFLNNIMQDLRKWYTLSWPNSAMTWGHDLWHFHQLNHLKLSKHVFKKSGSRFKNNLLLSSYWFISTK